MTLSSAPQNTEEGRAFLQERLALFGRNAFLLFAAIGLAALVTIFLVVP